MTLLDTFRSSGTREFCESLSCVYTWSTTHIYTRLYYWSPKSMRQERHWKQHDRYDVYVIAQQYSSSTYLSLRFHTARKLSACLYKMLLFQANLFFKKNCARLKWRNLKSRQSMGVCSDIGLCLFLTIYHLIRWTQWQMSEQTLRQGKTKALEEPVNLPHSPILILTATCSWTVWWRKVARCSVKV